MPGISRISGSTRASSEFEVGLKQSELPSIKLALQRFPHRLQRLQRAGTSPAEAGEETGVGVQWIWGATCALFRLQLAIDHDDLAVAEGCHVRVVGGDEECCLVLAVHVAQEGEDLVGGFAVQVAGRFVGEDKGGAVHQGAGDGDALLLAARELRRAEGLAV